MANASSPPAVDADFDDETLLSVRAIRYPFLLAYVIVFLLCVLGNLTIIAVVITRRSMRTVTNFFLANLAVADLLVGTFCVVQNATHFVLLSHSSWPFGAMLCHAYVYVLHLIPNASAGILVLLSMERFIAVLRPMLVHHLLTRTVLVASTLIVWSASAMMNSPYLITAQYFKFDDYATCARKNVFLFERRMDVLKVVTMINFIVWYATPLAILLGIYLTIGVVLLRSTGDGAVAQSSSCTRRERSLRQHPANQFTRLIHTANGCEKEEKHVLPKLEAIDSRRRVIRLVVVIVLSFALLSIPRYIYLMWSVYRDNTTPRCLHCVSALIQPITFLLMFLNSAINPLLYAFLSKRFRIAIVDTLCCRRERDKRRSRILQMSTHRLSSRQSPRNGHVNGTYLSVDNRSSALL